MICVKCDGPMFAQEERVLFRERWYVRWWCYSCFRFEDRYEKDKL